MKSLIVLIALVWCIGAGAAEDTTNYCALQVEVVNEAGAPLSQVSVRLRDSKHQEVRRFQVIKGSAAICDIPFGEYSLEVDAEDSCPLRTIVSGIRPLIPPHSYRLRLILYSCPGAGDGFRTRNSCTVYMRAQTLQGSTISGATVSQANSALAVTDAYGRAWFGIPAMLETEVTISKSGFKPVSVKISCEKKRQTEVLVSMEGQQ